MQSGHITSSMVFFLCEIGQNMRHLPFSERMHMFLCNSIIFQSLPERLFLSTLFIIFNIKFLNVQCTCFGTSLHQGKMAI